MNIGMDETEMAQAFTAEEREKPTVLPPEEAEAPEQKPEDQAVSQIRNPNREAPTNVKHLPAPMAANEKGLLIGGTLEEQYRLAQYYCKSGLMPRGLDTPEKVLVGVQLCRELSLPTVTSIGKVMVMNGTAAIHSDLPLALVRRSGQLRKIKEEFLRDDKGTVIGARCSVHRKGEEEEVVREFTIQDAKTADLWMKKNPSGKPSPWILYPQRMLQYRARSWALKDVFTDILFGVAILEYDFNATVVNDELIGGEEDQAVSLASQMNSRFLKGNDETQTHPEPQVAQGSQQ